MVELNVRNLEQIQEQDPARPSRIGTLFVASLAGAAIVSAIVMMSRPNSSKTRSTRDPLSELVAASKAPLVAAESLDGRDVSFPRLLSDDRAPTTALAAVKDERGRLVKQDELAPLAPVMPPPATDRLPVVPLPAGTMFNATSVVTDPRDALTGLAASAAAEKTDAELAPAGSEGGFQLQVASFKDQAEADKAVEDLRRRGHRAFRQAARVPDRGVWHRVRIGPFKTKLEALRYKDKFEVTERIAPFLVDPEKVKQAEERRAAQLSARAKRGERITGE